MSSEIFKTPPRFALNSIWRKRVAPRTFELRRIEAVDDHKVVTSSHTGIERTFHNYEFNEIFAPLVADGSSIILAGSGHRPEHIALGAQTLSEVRTKIFDFYVDLFTWLRPREVISGLARGFDLWLAWAALESDTRLIGACPYPQQVQGWPEEEAGEWEAIQRFCAEVHTVSPSYWAREGDNALYARNRWMIDRCTHLTSFWQGTRGGTAWTNDYAIARGKPRLVINALG